MEAQMEAMDRAKEAKEQGRTLEITSWKTTFCQLVLEANILVLEVQQMEVVVEEFLSTLMDLKKPN